MLIKILHTADTHLKERQYDSYERGQDYFRALMEVADIAIRERPHLICLVGDIFHVERPHPATVVNQFGPFIKKLNAAGFDASQIICINGNHDHLVPAWHTVTGGELTDLQPGAYAHRVTGVERPLNILVIPKGSAEQIGKFLDKMRETPLPAASADVTQWDIVLWHGAVQEFIGYPSPTAPQLADFDRIRYRALLLGDIHKHQFYQTQDNSLAGYPGSIELCDRGEPAEKSVSMVLLPLDQSQTVGEYPVPLTGNRPILFLNIPSQEILEQELEKIGAMEPSVRERLMVFVAHDSTLADVYSRLRAVTGDRAILRVSPVSGAVIVGEQTLDMMGGSGHSRGLGEFVGEEFTKRLLTHKDIEHLTLQLVERRDDLAQAPETIRRWVEDRLTTLPASL